MEKSEYSFGAYRYFIVPNDQISLFDAIEEKRKKAVQNFFSALVEEKKRSWEIKGRKHLLVFNRQVSSSVFICKFSMETKKTIFIESESDIENIDEIDYPFIYVNIRKVSIRHINSKSHQNGAKTDILHALDSLETILKKEHTDEETD